MLFALGGLLMLSGAIGLFEQAWTSDPTPGSTAQAQVGQFDFWVLALSWSPSYCASQDSDPEQCGPDAPGGMVVHGLWPQYESGYPEFCDAGPRRIPRAIASGMSDLIPSDDAVFHQWRKHGRCSGQSPEAYFQTVRSAAAKVTVPDLFEAAGRNGARLQASAIETAFIKVNPGLRTDMLAVSCHAGQIRDVRVCMTRTFQFRACREVDSRGCTRILDVPPQGM